MVAGRSPRFCSASEPAEGGESTAVDFLRADAA